jgi:hypothetical protein
MSKAKTLAALVSDGQLLSDGTVSAAEVTNFTSAARAVISVSGSGTYDSLTGVITVNGGVTSVNGQTGAVTITGSGLLGYTAENSANKGVANGYASLDGTGKVPSSQLPSYVDDVLEYANLAAFPATGTSGIIYVAQDTNKTYRWTGSVYVEISASPGTTDSLTEGSTNLYYTNTRARGSLSFTAGSGAYNSTTGAITIPTNTSHLSEVTNLFYTDARARAAISVTGSGSYNSTTGVITVTGGVTSVNTLTGAVTLSTTNIGEGTNLYYTTARFDTRIGQTSINALSDVDTVTTAPTSGQALAWNGTNWAPATISGGGGTARTTSYFNAAANQTSFTIVGGYTTNMVDVFRNGVKLQRVSDYTDTSGTAIVLAVGATDNDLIEVIAYSSAPSIANVYTQAQSDARYVQNVKLFAVNMVFGM